MPAIPRRPARTWPVPRSRASRRAPPRIIGSPDYKGQARDTAGYIRESIEHPSAYVVPGAMYSNNGQSFMPATYAKDLKPEQMDQLVAYLATLK